MHLIGTQNSFFYIILNYKDCRKDIDTMYLIRFLPQCNKLFMVRLLSLKSQVQFQFYTPNPILSLLFACMIDMFQA